MPLFDVLMPVKNGAPFLDQAIQSIQSQTLTDWRLLVLDHGSTDGSTEIVDLHARRDSRIQFHSFPDAVGLSGLLNKGLELVEAPYVMRMDADDESLPERMALTEAAFVSRPGIVLIGGQAIVMDVHGRLKGRLDVPTSTDELGRVSLFRNPFVHPSISLRSDFIFDRKIRYGRSIHAATDPTATINVPALAEDYLLFAELAVDGLAANMPQDILHYRQHPGGVSRTKYRDQLIVSAAISRHLAVMLARRLGAPAFDPVPFCTHGQKLMNVGQSLRYEREYEAMASVLSKAGGVWKEGRAELTWRKVFVDRLPLRVLARATLRWSRCRPSAHEVHTVKWALRDFLLRRPPISVDVMAAQQSTPWVARYV